MGLAVEKATAPFQHALSTRAGCECIGHALQFLTQRDPSATITSIDSIGAHDTISRTAMLSGLAEVDPAVLPFVRLFFGSQSRYLWEDNEGNGHTITQAEGGEQGDPSMPLLFALEQHRALVAVHSRILPGESLMAYLDVVSGPERVEHVHTALEEELFRHCHIRVHAGKTRVWNAAGIRLDACEVLERLAARHLGTPLGHVDFVQAELESVAMDHQVLLDRIFGVPAEARTNYMLRMVPPEAVEEFAHRHDTELFQCVGHIFEQDLSHCGDEVRETAGLPLILGGWACAVPNECLSQRTGRAGQTASGRFVRGIPPWPWSVCTNWRGSPRLQHMSRRLSVQEQSRGQQVSRLLRGGLWLWEHDYPCGMFWNLRREATREDGNMRLPAVWIDAFGMRDCSTMCQGLFEHSSGLKEAPWQAWLSPHHQRRI